MPRLTPVWSTAAIQGRQRRGQVSESSEAPTAHSPPIPRAARNRKISRCHQVCAKNDRPVNRRVGEDRQASGPGSGRAGRRRGRRSRRPAPSRPGTPPGSTSCTSRRRGSLVSATPEQLGDERGRDQHVQVHVQAVEQPAQPGGDARLPLRGGEVAQAPGSRRGRVAVAGAVMKAPEEVGGTSRRARRSSPIAANPVLG